MKTIELPLDKTFRLRVIGNAVCLDINDPTADAPPPTTAPSKTEITLKYLVLVCKKTRWKPGQLREMQNDFGCVDYRATTTDSTTWAFELPTDVAAVHMVSKLSSLTDFKVRLAYPSEIPVIDHNNMWSPLDDIVGITTEAQPFFNLPPDGPECVCARRYGAVPSSYVPPPVAQ